MSADDHERGLGFRVRVGREEVGLLVAGVLLSATALLILVLFVRGWFGSPWGDALVVGAIGLTLLAGGQWALWGHRHFPRLDPRRTLEGGGAIAIGLFISYFVSCLRNLDGSQPWPLVIFTLPFFGIGLWRLGTFESVMRKLRSSGRDYEAIVGGSVAVVMGALLTAFGFLDPNEDNFEASRWVVAMAGLTFFSAGLFPLSHGLGLLRHEVVARLLVALAATAFGATVTGIWLSGVPIAAIGAVALDLIALYQWFLVGRALVRWRG